jgi:hypothetical protein
MSMLPILRSMPAAVRDKLQRSAEYLVSQRAFLQHYASLYDIVDAMDPQEKIPPPTGEERKRQKTIHAVMHHLGLIVNQVLRQLWIKGFLLGSATIEELLYDLFRDPETSDPVHRMLLLLHESGVHRPGVVVYPLHSIGIAGAGFLRAFTETEVNVHLTNAGIVLSPQTNSLAETITFLKHALNTLGVEKQLPVDLIEHNRRSRPTRWLERNPLLIMRIRSFTGSYYQNQWPLIIKLRIATALLYMIAVLERPYVKDKHSWTSSSRVNNWQTLDIHHYILLESGIKRRPMNCLCVPMNIDAKTLTELSDVSADLHPRVWDRLKTRLPSLISMLASLEKGYLDACFGNERQSTSAKVHSKLYDALGYFCRSFSHFRNTREHIVQAAIAFETLLTDSYAAPVDKHIQQRLSKALRGLRGNRALVQSVKELYKARSEVVHEGSTVREVDMDAVHTAFVHAFMVIGGRLDGIQEKVANPISSLLGEERFEKKPRISVTLGPKLSEQLKNISVGEGAKPAALVQKAVRQFVRKKSLTSPSP